VRRVRLALLAKVVQQVRLAKMVRQVRRVRLALLATVAPRELQVQRELLARRVLLVQLV
jgi:hypothetical protein